MDYFKITISSILSLVVLFILAKLIGNRQMSQLTLFDYVNGITIGSIAAEMATDIERHWSKALLAMVIYGVATALISFACCKSQKLRRFVNGRAIILYDKGKFMYDGFKRARLDMNEFLAQCRINGYFNIAEIETAFMEQNGRISFLAKSDYRPATPKDMALLVPEATFTVTVMLDGRVLRENLAVAGYTEDRLLNEMKKAMIKDTATVMLATVDSGGTVTFYLKQTLNQKNDIFM